MFILYPEIWRYRGTWGDLWGHDGGNQVLETTRVTLRAAVAVTAMYVPEPL